MLLAPNLVVLFQSDFVIVSFIAALHLSRALLFPLSVFQQCPVRDFSRYYFGVAFVLFRIRNQSIVGL